jgi:hypothetical protein
MTTSAQPAPVSKATSRRALLAGALGGLGAVAVSAIARVDPVRAAGDDGAPVVVGGFYSDARSQLTLSNQANDNVVMWVASNTDSGGGGGTAVVGYSDHGIGVQGQSPFGTGVRAISTTGSAVYGSSTTGYAIQGTSSTSAGVYGTSGTGTGVVGTGSTGTGVYGVSDSNVGVHGNGGTGVGVYGYSSSSTAVEALSSSGVGVYGTSYATGKPAVLGVSSFGSTGVQGYSGPTVPPTTAKTGVFGYAAQDSASVGVRGESPTGFGVYGKTTGTGFAGYFNGKVYMSQFVEMGEIATPASPTAN